MIMENGRTRHDREQDGIPLLKERLPAPAQLQAPLVVTEPLAVPHGEQAPGVGERRIAGRRGIGFDPVPVHTACPPAAPVWAGWGAAGARREPPPGRRGARPLQGHAPLAPPGGRPGHQTPPTPPPPPAPRPGGAATQTAPPRPPEGLGPAIISR